MLKKRGFKLISECKVFLIILNSFHNQIKYIEYSVDSLLQQAMNLSHCLKIFITADDIVEFV